PNQAPSRMKANMTSVAEDTPPSVMTLPSVTIGPPGIDGAGWFHAVFCAAAPACAASHSWAGDGPDRATVPVFDGSNALSVRIGLRDICASRMRWRSTAMESHDSGQL